MKLRGNGTISSLSLHNYHQFGFYFDIFCSLTLNSSISLQNHDQSSSLPHEVWPKLFIFPLEQRPKFFHFLTELRPRSTRFWTKRPIDASRHTAWSWMNWKVKLHVKTHNWTGLSFTLISVIVFYVYRSLKESVWM